MPRRLLRAHTESFYHVVSRTTDRQRTMGGAEKRHFREWMRRLEEFTGVQVVTYCLMENHFHMLVRVPQRNIQPALTEAALRRLLPLIYRSRELLTAVQELDRAAQDASGRWMAEILARYQARRFSLSIFLKELKQRYTRWHNRRHQRVGTLWECRFRSVLVEGDERALLTIAAYIDLNPVRAGLVTDPKDYHWCGYAEAVAGVGGASAVASDPGNSAGSSSENAANADKSRARKGLGAILERTSFGVNRRVTWSATGPRYRMLLYGHGEERAANAQTGDPGRRGMTREQVEAELERGGKLAVHEILLCKVRYLTDGAAIGGAGFLQEVFDENREQFGARRTTAGKRMRGADWGGLEVLRGLSRAVFG